MPGGDRIDSRRRRILAGALGTALLPRFVFAQGQRNAGKNREIYLYRGAHREQLLEEFFSPHFKDLPPAAFPRHRHYVADRFNFFTIAYNTNLVKANEVPDTYEDLIQPRFAGRVGLEASDVDWFGAMVKSM